MKYRIDDSYRTLFSKLIKATEPIEIYNEDFHVQKPDSAPPAKAIIDIDTAKSQDTFLNDLVKLGILEPSN